MNRFKSYFVSAYIGASVLITAWSAVRLVQDGVTVGRVGTFLTAFTITLYFGNLFRFTTPRTSRRLTRITAMLAVGAFLAAVGSVIPVQPDKWAVLPAVGIFLLWFVYVNWYSRLERPLNTQLATGSKLPTVSFVDSEGTAVSSTDFSGQKVLYLFYRGNWCPFCMAQIREVAAQYQELEQRGVRVVLISPQPPDHTRQLADRFQVPMTFLVDTGNRAARQLGIAHEHGVPAGIEVLGYDAETVLPTVLLVGEDGRLLYSSQTNNYRIRPEPAEFLRALDTLTTT